MALLVAEQEIDEDFDDLGDESDESRTSAEVNSDSDYEEQPTWLHQPQPPLSQPTTHNGNKVCFFVVVVFVIVVVVEFCVTGPYPQFSCLSNN